TRFSRDWSSDVCSSDLTRSPRSNDRPCSVRIITRRIREAADRACRARNPRAALARPRTTARATVGRLLLGFSPVDAEVRKISEVEADAEHVRHGALDHGGVVFLEPAQERDLRMDRELAAETEIDADAQPAVDAVGRQELIELVVELLVPG